MMTWLVTLTDKERHDLYKAGDKLAVIQDALNAVTANPGIFPTSYDTAGYVHDVDFFDFMTEMTAKAAALWRKLNDTRIASGAECMKGVTAVRGYVDAAAKTTPGLQATSTLLASHFKHNSPAKTTPPSTP